MLISNAFFTVFDFETTGLYPYSGDKICEIGAIRSDSFRKRPRRFHSLVDPGKPVSSGAYNVNGITADMLAGQPSIDKILPDFMKFIDGSVLVAYNAGFDLGFLRSALGRDSWRLAEFKVIDVLALARRLLPGIGRYNLGSVSTNLGIEVLGEHRAMADCLMTWKVFVKQIDLLKKDGIVELEDIILAGPASRETSPIKKTRDRTTRLIEDAIYNGGDLVITYRSAWHDTVTRRTVTPKEIKSGYDRSYMVAHCHLKNEERNFRIDCILEAEPVTEDI
jgi:DNA polymerase III epsilon subunit family exonuclease